MQTTIPSQFKKIALGVMLAYGFAVSAVHAASMGKMDVKSSLGSPLKAEFSVNATPQELSGMTARLASPEVFQQAEIPYTRALSALSFTVDTKSAQPVVRITSDRPIHDPFLDFLVELVWSGGRMMREYTILLDPPDSTDKAAAEAAIATPREYVAPTPSNTATTAPSEPSSYLPSPAQTQPTQVPTPAPQVVQQQTPVVPVNNQPAKASPNGGDYWTVSKGDTLGEIARETKPDAVSLDQMLVGLYKNNPEAFLGNNMNRLKSGAIVNIPDSNTLTSVPQPEARSIVQAQANDWNAYRRKLAGAVETLPAARESEGSQTSKGTIGGEVTDKAAPETPNKDQVQVSRSDASGKKGGASEEDLIAKDRALKEANERVEQLERNVGELQRLLEMKNQSLAALQQQSTTPSVAPGTLPQPATTPPAASSEVPPGKAVLTTPLPPPLPAAQVEAENAAKQQAALAANKPQEEEDPIPPSLTERLATFIGSPAGTGTLAALLLGLLGIFIAKARKRAKESAADDRALILNQRDEGQIDWNEDKSNASNTPETTVTPSSPKPASAASSDDYDDIDPVAEADVYIAYGRDPQAEELLRDALKKTPQRTAIHSRLLDIYARRQAIPEFENVAAALHAVSGGQGTDWEKAVELANQLNIRTGLFAGSSAIATAAEVAQSSAAAEPVAMDFKAPEEATPPEPIQPSFDYASVNLNLEQDKSAAPSATAAPASEPKQAPAPAATPSAEPSGDATGPEEVNTKLDLAKAYIEMGDADGARELLDEVIKEGGPEQQASANTLLSSLAGK